MRLTDFDYNLPKELIAQEPAKPRDHSRLLVIDKKTGKIAHKYFYNIIDYLRKGDVLVLNNTKVMKARLLGKKQETGGKIEVFLLRQETSKTLSVQLDTKCLKGDVWQCLIGGKVRKEGLEVNFGGGLTAVIMRDNQDGTWLVKFNRSGAVFRKLVEKIGQTPLPPYIKRMSKLKSQNSKLVNDEMGYQTVYADDKKLGSVAAPTAGLHFTPALLNKIKAKGVKIVYITLQVGLGTFAPVKVDDITKHKMHVEWVEVDGKIVKKIAKAKGEGRRIVAVGTTSARALESMEAKFSIFNFQFSNNFQINKFSKNCAAAGYKFQTDIFIYPGYQFKVVDAMITNFHLPKSTLLMLVSAFAKALADKSALAGRDKIMKAYRSAIRKKYRFFSYGDAMLIV